MGNTPILVKACMWIKRGAIALPLCMVISGCASAPGPSSPPMAEVTAAMQYDPVRPERSTPTDGSLFDERAALSEMFINPKARRIGDIVTIKIEESASASNKAATTTDRSSSMSAGVDALFGTEKHFAKHNPFFNPFGSVKGGIDSEFEGTGTTQRSGDLNAYMTARVADVLPNGNLVIEGNREVRVNAENQLITLTGVVRPRDISAQNIIRSTYIADARIAYSGTGVINDRQRPGWLTRVFDTVWPF